jgi:hypothetical protein
MSGTSAEPQSSTPFRLPFVSPVADLWEKGRPQTVEPVADVGYSPKILQGGPIAEVIAVSGGLFFIGLRT